TTETVSAAPRSPEAELDKALDAVAAILRVLGRYSFDLPDQDAAAIAQLCERWATHLLLVGPCPTADDDAGNRKPAHARDWASAVQYATNLRKREHAHIGKSLQDLRETIWAFVHGLNQSMSAGGDADTRMKGELVRLKNAAHNRSPADLKREAISVAETIGVIFEERSRKQTQHVRRLGERMAELGRALEEARREVAFDSLTQLFNRKTFDEEISRTTDMSGLFEQPACLLLVDADHFKAINDTYGHPMGDEVLRKLAETLIRTFRRRDDIVARYGGEEFGIILRETVEKEAVMLTERLLENTRSLRIEHGGKQAQVTVSVGVAEIVTGESSEAWIARADRGLYNAKNTGRDRLVVATSIPPSK
ncbi:MAG TPA: GGDEF domain-containing protein, partial [Polyangiaceae bacterium]